MSYFVHSFMANFKQDSSGNWKKTSDSKKNYTIVDGQKVEKQEQSKSSGLSDSWNKDTVTLSEAKQQSSESEAYMASKQTPETTLIDDGYTITKVETSTSYEPIKVGSDVKSTAQTEPIVTEKVTVTPKNTDKEPQYYEVQKSYQPSPVNPNYQPDETSQGPIVLSPEQSSRLNRDALNVSYDSGNALEGSKSYTPAETQEKPILQQIKDNLSTGYAAGTNPEENTVDVGLERDLYKNTAEYRNYNKAEKLASYLDTKAATVIDTVVDSKPVSTAYGILLPDIVTPDTIKSVNKGAVSSVTGLIPLAAGSLVALSVAEKQPEIVPAMTVVGLGIIAGSTVKLAKEDPAFLAGNIVGGVVAGKVVGGARNVADNLPAIKVAPVVKQDFLLKITDVPVNPLKPQVLDVPLLESGNVVPEYTVFAKPTTAGKADLLIKLTDEQASTVLDNYAGKSRNINTAYGSFFEFEPTMKIDVISYPKSGAKQITTPELTLIGESKVSPAKRTLPQILRLETKETITPASVSSLEQPAHLLPTITADMETTVTDVTNRLQLRSGKRDFNAFVHDTEGTIRTDLKPRYTPETMIPVKERVISVKQEVQLIERNKPVGIDFREEFKRIYNRQPTEPLKTPVINLSKEPVRERVTSPIFTPRTTPEPQHQPVVKPVPIPVPITRPAPSVKRTTTPSPKRSTQPAVNPSRSPSESPTKVQPAPTINIPSVTPVRPRKAPVVVDVPSKKKSTSSITPSKVKVKKQTIHNTFGDITRLQK